MVGGDAAARERRPSLLAVPLPNAKQILRSNSTDAAAAANSSIHRKTRYRGDVSNNNPPIRIPRHDSPRNNTSQSARAAAAAAALKVAQRLLSMSPSSSQQTTTAYPPTSTFEQILANTRTNNSVLQRMRLSPAEAEGMFILPPDLLGDVHSAIMLFGQREHFQGAAVLAANEQITSKESEEFGHGDSAAANAFSQKTKGDSSAAEVKPFAKRNKKVPGPILCARLLELIGIPSYHQHANSGDSAAPCTMIVHSSQIDQILECCVETTIALSRSCETGKHSLIGSDFNLQPYGERKTAAHLCEEIWRAVRNMRIKYTSGKRKSSHAPAMMSMEDSPQQIRIGRVGSFGSSAHPVLEYLSAARDVVGAEEIDRGPLNYHDVPIGEVSEDRIPWSPKDQRRYDKSVVLFNTVLAAYAKLSSSASGAHPQVRRDMVKNAERLLLEVAQNDQRGTGGTNDPSPSTILQYPQPDVVSFNTTMRALSEWAPRQKRESHSDEDSIYTGAERTESIFKTMQSLWDEDRSTRTTLQSMHAAWEEQGGPNPNIPNRDGGEWAEQFAPPPRHRAIAPNTSSYNSVLKAWSRSSDPDAALRALEVYQTMIRRINVSCLARESLILENQENSQRRGHRGVTDAFPDSQTFVLLLQSLQKKFAESIGFRNALDTVESVFDSMKKWDAGLQWSGENALLKGAGAPILNVFSYNSLITTLSRLPTNSWEESYQSCLRIEDIIEEMNASSIGHNAVMYCLPIVITAWNKCAEQADQDKEKLQLCAEKCGAHISSLLMAPQIKQGGHDYVSKNYIIRAVNDTISFYGRAEMPSDADELFLRAKSCNTHNLGTLVNTIDALCDNGLGDIAHVEKAHSYLKDFERDKMRMSRSLIVPDMKYTQMYNSCIAGYLHCDAKQKGLEQAQALLAHMISSHEANPRHIARPNTTSFARVMSMLSRRGDNSQRMEALLGKMEALHQRSEGVPKGSPDAKLVANVVPNIVIYNCLLKSYARRYDDEALQSAMKLMGRMDANPNVQPDDVSNSYILTLSSRKNGSDTNAATSSSSSTNVDIGKLNVDDLNLGDLNLSQNLDLNLSPNLEGLTSQSFKSVMNVYTTAGTIEGAEKGAALLRKLEEMYSSGEISFKPDTFLYNKVLNAYYLCEKNNSNGTISPAAKSQEILNALCERCEAEGDEEHNALHCNDVSFSTCIHTWCKSSRPDSAERTEQLLRQKEAFSEKYCNIQIKSADYNSAIKKWQDDSEKGPERATLLFEEMLEKHENSEERARPNAATLNALLDVYAKSYEKKLAGRAQGYLNRINRLHKEGKSCILPDVISYRSVIDAWVRQWGVDSPQKVDALVKEMIDKYKHEGRKDLRPDSNTLNLVLKACSHAPAMWVEKDVTKKGNSNDHPIAIANNMFSLLKGGNDYGASPTHATYSFMFHIYRQHMDFHDKRYPPLMRNLWKHCCRDGLVSQLSLSSFRDSVLEDEFWDAIGGKYKYLRLGLIKAENITIKDLPKEWNRNVVPLKRRNSKQTQQTRRSGI